MKQQQVIDIMSETTSLEDWNKKSKAIFRNYDGNRPEFWYKDIIVSGLFERKRKEWEEQESEIEPEIHKSSTGIKLLGLQIRHIK